MIDAKEQYRMLVESVLLVSASAEEQVAALPDFVCITDEVAMTFGDAFLLVAQLQRSGLVSAEAAQALKTLDEFFVQMPRDHVLADPDSLKFHSFWAEARRLAEIALSALGEEKRAPQLSSTVWQEG